MYKGIHSLPPLPQLELEDTDETESVLATLRI